MFTRCILREFKPKKLIIFSRDESKQYEMRHEFDPDKIRAMRYFIGDVRDLERLKQAMVGVDYVIHAAAMKHVPIAEYNPFECVKTNINGAENVICAAIYNKVKKVIALSTDKAANPINLYGATKLAADKMFVSGNAMSGDGGTCFSVVRYGNVVGSRGSVIPFFLKCKAEKRKYLPITDSRMTRFWLTLDYGAQFVLKCLSKMRGGEIFIPKIPSMRIIDLAKTIYPGCDIRIVGIRPGEKLHEVLVPQGNAHNTVEFDDHFVIQPAFPWWDEKAFVTSNSGKSVPEEFEYRSDNNSEWLTPQQLQQMIL